ncbi:hypothetical protein BACI349Y_900002 [Bacillus sp. 349Y]|nr:hypothetical protein BACI349Y_900002 [Bacillus sp. 349Y]
MVGLLGSILATMIILMGGVYFVIWTEEHVEGAVLQMTVIVVYGICFIAAVTQLIIDVFRII